jgi:hypothetical protein
MFYKRSEKLQNKVKKHKRIEITHQQMQSFCEFILLDTVRNCAHCARA